MGNYLYNGVSLPPLVGWDGMPPAGIFILHDSRNGTYVLCGVSAAPQCVLVNGEDEPALPFDVFGTVFVALEGAESWGESQNFEPLEYFSATEGAYIRQRYVGWLWTQSDILTADGQNIYMAATAPIKVVEDSGITIDDVRRHYRRGYTAGVVFGRNSGGNLEGNSAADVAKASKNAAIPAAAYSAQARDNTPGNYLYNGVELPPLPHWDDMPPFGVFIIYIASERLYRLYGANDAPFCIKTAGAEKIAFSADIFGSYQKARVGETNWFGLKAFDGNLSDIADFEDGIYILRPENKIIWTKETIFNSDGQSVFLAATEPIKIELPEQLTEADLRRSWRRGMALGVIVGVKARKIIAQTQPPPDEPITADYYLYGRPSESGNVALADGDGYAVYNGVAAPPLPEWDKDAYPYALVLETLGGTIRAVITNVPVLQNSGSIRSDEEVTYFTYDLNGDGWYVAKEPTSTWLFQILTNNVMWADYNVKSYDAPNTVSVYASAPIPLESNEPAAAVYGGEKLPVLPEWEGYNYKVVYRIGIRYHLRAYQNSPITELSTPLFPTEKPRDLLRAEGNWRSSHIDDSGNWYKSDTTSTDGVGMSLLVSTIVWANVDVFTSSGELYIPASDPIPAYEQKE